MVTKEGVSAARGGSRSTLLAAGPRQGRRAKLCSETLSSPRWDWWWLDRNGRLRQTSPPAGTPQEPGMSSHQTGTATNAQSQVHPGATPQYSPVRARRHPGEGNAADQRPGNRQNRKGTSAQDPLQANLIYEKASPLRQKLYQGPSWPFVPRLGAVCAARGPAAGAAAAFANSPRSPNRSGFDQILFPCCAS